jgi:arylsulfatase
LWLNGEAHGRRDYAFLYNINTLEAVVKEQFKLTIPGGKMENAVLAKFYHLFRDTREEWPLSTEIGAWSSAKMVAMIQRHIPERDPAPGYPTRASTTCGRKR